MLRPDELVYCGIIIMKNLFNFVLNIKTSRVSNWGVYYFPRV
jgi:hypothetical protein